MQIDITRLLIALSQCLDFTRHGIDGHHQRVALTALSLAHEMGLEGEAKTLLLAAAVIHDIGVKTWGEKEQLHSFEVEDPWEHCRRGCELVSRVKFLRPVAQVLLSHHDRWDGTGNPSGLEREGISLLARAIHLADRVDVLLDSRRRVLDQRHEIVARVGGLAGKVFDPEVARVFGHLARRESFWLDLVSPYIRQRLRELNGEQTLFTDEEGLHELATLFAAIIDEQSPFTYRHSRRVSHLAGHLGQCLAFSALDVKLLEVAGLLHDLGKLSLPVPLVDSPHRLSPEERNLVYQHPYYTRCILRQAGGPGSVPEWAGYHHERLDGSGYPYHLAGDEICLGSRIIAVSDVFVGMREDRPYRRALPIDEVEGFLQGEVRSGRLDATVVTALLDSPIALEPSDLDNATYS